MRYRTILILFFFLSACSWCHAQEELGERITQEEFAVELIKNMRMHGWLPTSALAGDCVEVLKRLGISPLKGWDNKALLEQEDYLVILAKLNGKERMVHKRAVAVEEKNTEAINKKWQESYDATGKWVPLDELLKDTRYFPNGPPESPYGLEYQDQNGDHKVDKHFLPAVGLMKLGEIFAAYNYEL